MKLHRVLYLQKLRLLVSGVANTSVSSRFPTFLGTLKPPFRWFINVFPSQKTLLFLSSVVFVSPLNYRFVREAQLQEKYMIDTD